MRVLICGSRHYDDYSEFCQKIDEIEDWDNKQPITVIEGGAKGADYLARIWAKECGWDLEEYPANWKELGKAAGPIRNKQMLEEGKPDLVVAFLAPDSRGTANMIKQAQEANIPVKVCQI